MSDIVQFVAQVGFPITVATWLLVKLQVSLDNFATAARELTSKNEVHTNQCAKCQGSVSMRRGRFERLEQTGRNGLGR